MLLVVGLLLLPCHLYAEPLTSGENEELQRNCGKLQKQPRNVFKSINTKNATRYEVPWATQILTYFEEESLSGWAVHCSGSIISKRHILTAAHCIYSRTNNCNHTEDLPEVTPISKYRILLSTACNNDGCDVEKSQIFKIRKAYAHRGFYLSDCPKAKFENDVAIIELERNIIFSKTAQPVCFGDFPPKAKEKLTIHGYGIKKFPSIGPGILRKYTAPVLPRAQCEKIAQRLFNESLYHDVHCSRNSKQRVCGGDSGGGEIVERRKKKYVVGVVSYGKDRCGFTTTPDSFTLFSPNLSKHYGWICAVTGICSGWKPTDEVKKALKEEYYTFEKGEI